MSRRNGIICILAAAPMVIAAAGGDVRTRPVNRGALSGVMDAAELTSHVEAAVAPLDGIAAVYLFGSVAAGTDTPASDVDLGVLYDVPPAGRLDAGPLDLEGDLERPVRGRDAERLLRYRTHAARLPATSRETHVTDSALVTKKLALRRAHPSDGHTSRAGRGVPHRVGPAPW